MNVDDQDLRPGGADIDAENQWFGSHVFGSTVVVIVVMIMVVF